MSLAPLEQADPVAAFFHAHRRGMPVRLTTSGTTAGQPRTITRTTGSWVRSFDECARRLALDAGSRCWIPGPLAATMNLFAACLCAHVGATWTTGREGCTHAQLTPAQLQALLDDPTGCPAGLHCLVAGDGLAPALAARARAVGMRTSHYYGAAELSLVAWGSDADDLRLFDGVEARVSEPDEDGVGVLWVRSPWLATVATTREGFASVGDLGRLDGDRLRVLGRPGACTTAGATVLIAPIERMLQASASGRVVVLAVPDERVGELLACVAPTDELDAVRCHARRELAGPHRPRRWIALDELPLTAAGKVDRQALVARALETRHRVPAGGRP